jgi:site-specific DNA-methyltransferase (adenine-specific)
VKAAPGQSGTQSWSRAGRGGWSGTTTIRAKPRRKPGRLQRTAQRRAAQASRAAGPYVAVAGGGAITGTALHAPLLAGIVLGAVTVRAGTQLYEEYGWHRKGGKAAMRRRRKYQGTASRREIRRKLSPAAARKHAARRCPAMDPALAPVIIGTRRRQVIAGSRADSYLVIAPPQSMKTGLISCWAADAPGAHGLEFMGREWDTFKPSGARIRKPSEQDQSSGRAHNGSTMLVARNLPESYSTGAGRRGKPGIGDREPPWVSNQGWNAFRCRNEGCGKLSHGGSPCTCEHPDFARADNRWNAFQTWCEAWAAECLRVLKPGGHLVAFGGTRTYHRLACAIEDAGFEIRDSLHWLYGSGFPKGKACLKPAHEPIILARKPARRAAPLPGLDACRIAVTGADYARNASGDRGHYGNRSRDMDFGMTAGHASDIGRWPPNVLLGEQAAAELDRQSGITRSQGGSRGAGGQHGAYNAIGAQTGFKPGLGDEGGASRFFPVFRYEAKADASERPRLADGTAWPTVKPVALMQWLVRLVTPPGGIVLDPFCGTGTTGEACAIEGFGAVLADRDPRALALTRVRLAKPVQPAMFGLEA